MSFFYVQRLFGLHKYVGLKSELDNFMDYYNYIWILCADLQKG